MTNGLFTPGNTSQVRLQQIKEVVTKDELDSFLRKTDWVLLAMYQRTDQVFEQELRLVYVFGKVGR